MTWNALPADIRTTAETVLAPGQLEAFKLELLGYGTRRIALELDLSRGAVTDRLTGAHRNLLRAGIRQDGSGQWRKEAA